MSNDNSDLLKRLDSHIEKMGQIFQTASKNYFWIEEDLRGTLFSLIQQDKAFSCQIANVAIPLVHAQYPTKLSNTQHYDLAVLDESATKWVVEKKSLGGLPANDIPESKVKLITAIEMKYLYSSTDVAQKLDSIESKDIDKLSNNKEQFLEGTHNYELIFVLTKYAGRNVYDYDEVIRCLEIYVEKWKRKTNLDVYCFPDNLDQLPYSWKMQAK